jgi:hypothetical protein
MQRIGRSGSAHIFQQAYRKKIRKKEDKGTIVILRVSFRRQREEIGRTLCFVVAKGF